MTLSTSETPLSPAWKEGDVILGLYDVRGAAGAGNFGTVYRVHHLNWRRDLAVKSPSEGTLVSRHYLEDCLDGARRWMDLGLHPNIVTCFYVREVEGIPRIFMEYAPGRSLKEKLAEGVDLRDALDYAIQISRALAYAHGQGVVHGDLKPENCLFAREGSLKVADFGLGSVEGFAGDAGGWLRALKYIAPERWGLAGRATPKADIFSFGAILGEMIAGDGWLGRNGDEAEAPDGGGVDAGPADTQSSTGVPPLLAQLAGECVNQDPDERPENFGALGDRLRELYLELAGGYPRRNVENGSLRIANLNKKGISLFDVGMRDEALVAIEDAVKGDPSHLDAGYNHTLLLWERGRMTDREVVRWLEMKAE